jgi:hypothetical protein
VEFRCLAAGSHRGQEIIVDDPAADLVECRQGVRVDNAVTAERGLKIAIAYAGNGQHQDVCALD